MAAALLAVFYVAGASATLSGSPYNGLDGTLDTVAGIQTATDDPSGSSDNAFGQGTKEDNSAVTIVNGSIPPNKNDLSNFYEGSTQNGGSTFLYLGWTRLVNIGNANLDFEINKHATTGFTGTTTGALTLNRTAGDLLVTYDFGGSGAPTLGLNRWLTSASVPVVSGFPTNTCLSANSFPCWGDHITLNSTNSEGSVSSDGLFGEAVVNLTGTGVIGSGVCDFGQATTFLKSRSSSSFTAEIKDFIAPVSTPISPCASITIIKHTLNAAGSRAGDSTSFAYTTNGTGLSNFNLSDTTGTDNTSNTKTFTGLGPGNYTVTETDPSPNYAMTDLSCTSSGSGTSATPTSGNSTRTATITLNFAGSVTCTYTNQQQTGAIRVTKVSSKGSTPLAGASFTYALVTNGTAGTPTAFSGTTDANGHLCVAGLAFGTYRIAESSAPGGYAKDAGTQDVTVSSAGTCTSGYVSPTNSFVDTPLSTITVGFHSLAGAGVTSATVQCTGDSGTANLPEGDATKTLGNGTSTLTPGTYSCTVVVDP